MSKVSLGVEKITERKIKTPGINSSGELKIRFVFTACVEIIARKTEISTRTVGSNGGSKIPSDQRVV